MYSLYLSNKLESGDVEETLIFSSNVPSETLALISPSLDVESGAAGSLDFTVPPSNNAYNLVEMMRTEVIFKINDKEMWRGRVLNTDTDFYNQMKVEVEGEMSYLNDTYQPQKEYDNTTLRQFLETVISIHNKKVTDENGNPIGPIDKRFEVGAIYVEDVVDATVNEMFRKSDYDTTMSCLKSVANTYKGYFIVRWYTDEVTGKRTRKLDFVKNFVDTCSQSIDFGHNLLDFNKAYNMQDLCTVAMPIGAKMEDKAGDEIFLYDTENDQPINFLNSNGYFEPYDTSTGNYDPNRYARVCYLNTGEFQTGDKIYVSVAQLEDTRADTTKDGMWCFADANGIVIDSVKRWSAQEGIDAYEKHELTIPPGANRFRVGGYVGLQPEIKVYRQKAKERVDECYTIEGVASYDDGTVKHTVGDIYIIHKALFEKYGWHEKKLTFGDLDNSQKLNDMAVEYLKTTQFEQMTLDVKAIDLSNLNVDYEQIWINMNVPVCSKPHGIEYGQLTLPCTKIKIELDSPESNEYTLGYSSSDKISDTQSNVSADLSGLMDQIPAVSTTLQAARDNALEILNAFGDAGYVTFEKHQNSNAIQAIIIANAQDPELATKKWVWNQGGFGYQERDTINDSWSNIDLAITMDGQIVANRIVSGYMYADRIRGGTLKLGVAGASPGDIQVYDGNGESLSNRVAAVEKDWGFTNETVGENGWGVRLNAGEIYGYGKGSNTSFNNMTTGPHNENCCGRINFQQLYDNDKVGIDFRSHILGVNTDTIYVADGFDGHNQNPPQVYIAKSTHVEVSDPAGGKKRLEFTNGFLIGVSKWDEDGQYWYTV